MPFSKSVANEKCPLLFGITRLFEKTKTNSRESGYQFKLLLDNDALTHRTLMKELLLFKQDFLNNDGFRENEAPRSRTSLNSATPLDAATELETATPLDSMTQVDTAIQN